MGGKRRAVAERKREGERIGGLGRGEGLKIAEHEKSAGKERAHVGPAIDILLYSGFEYEVNSGVLLLSSRFYNLNGIEFIRSLFSHISALILVVFLRRPDKKNQHIVLAFGPCSVTQPNRHNYSVLAPSHSRNRFMK